MLSSKKCKLVNREISKNNKTKRRVAGSKEQLHRNNMKFGKRFEDDLQEVGWEQHYFRYTEMKLFIKRISEEHPTSHQSIRVSTGLLNDRLIGSPCKECKAAGHTLIKQLQEESIRIHEFVETCIQSRRHLFETQISCEVESLLDDVKHNYEVAHEVQPAQPKVLKALASLAVWIDDIGALKQFVLVNFEAQRKIVKKYLKWCQTSVSGDSAKFDSRNDRVRTGTAEPQIRQRRMSRQSTRYPARDKSLTRQTEKSDLQAQRTTIEQKIGFDCQRLLREISKLRQQALLLETQILVTRSSYHDFVQDHRMLLRIENQRKKVSRLEASSSRLLQHTIAMEDNNHPATFLLAGVILSLVTLLVTYTLSGSIYIDDDESITILQEKGFFISASIDQAPASNVGTLGLTISLMFLAVTMVLKHKLIKKMLRGRTWAITRRISFLFGMLCVFCGNGVAAFQHQDHAFAHNSFAAGFFASGLVHVFLETAIEVANELTSSTMRKWRSGIATGLVFSVVGFLVIMSFIVSGECERTQCPERLLKDVAALLEVLAFILLLLWFGSYYWMLRKSNFDFQVVQRVPLNSDMYLRSENSYSNLKRKIDLHKKETICSGSSSSSEEWMSS